MVSLIGGGGAAAPETVVESETDLSGLWNVVVLNDPVNLMSYVTMVFKRVLGMEQSEAEQHMMEAKWWAGDKVLTLAPDGTWSERIHRPL